MTKKILILPGDGIGPEIVAQAEKVLAFLINERGFDLEIDHGLLGGCAVDAAGTPFPDETLSKAKASAAILLVPLVAQNGSLSSALYALNGVYWRFGLVLNYLLIYVQRYCFHNWQQLQP